MPLQRGLFEMSGLDARPNAENQSGTLSPSMPPRSAGTAKACESGLPSLRSKLGQKTAIIRPHPLLNQPAFIVETEDV